MKYFRRILSAVVLALAASHSAVTFALDWPTRPIRIIVPFAPGAGTDVIMRYYANILGESLGQGFVIENKPGANGVVGTAGAVKQPADGYNFFIISNSTVSAAPHLYRTVQYDVDKDVLPVAPFILAPSVLLANPQFPADNFDQFLAQVRKPNQKYSYAYANSVGLVAGSTLRKKANLDLADVSYKGSPQALTDLIGGQVTFVIVDTIAAATTVKSKRVKVLAVTSEKRSPLYPGVAAMAEKFPGIDAYAWVGLGAPAGTPPEIIEKLNNEINRISKEKKTIDYFADMGSSLHPLSATEYRTFVQGQNKQWATMLREAGVKPE